MGWQNGSGPYTVFANTSVNNLQRIYGDNGLYFDLYDNSWIGDVGDTRTFSVTKKGVTSNSIQAVAGDYRLKVTIEGTNMTNWSSIKLNIGHSSDYSYIYCWWDFQVLLERYVNNVIDSSFTPINITGSCEVSFDVDGLEIDEYEGNYYIMDTGDNVGEELSGQTITMNIFYSGVGEINCYLKPKLN